MPQSLPDLSLTHGQLLWALNLGRNVDERMKAQVRYLRQLGIPATSQEATPGSGNRVRYGLHDLVELGVALCGLRHRFRPNDIKAVLDADRQELRRNFEEAWRGLPDDVLNDRWVKSRGDIIAAIRPEVHLRMHDRRSRNWGRLEFLGPERAETKAEYLIPIEIFEDGEYRLLVPVMATSIPWIAWALEAPAIRTGPR